MKDSQISGAATIIEISGKEIEVYPLSDKDLDTLTQWIRYKIQKDAREQSEFTESASEVAEIRADAFKNSLRVMWFDSIGINILLNNTDGLVEVIHKMTKGAWKKDWFRNKFGEGGSYSEEQLENRKVLTKVFLELNTLDDGEEKDPKEEDAKKKTE